MPDGGMEAQLPPLSVVRAEALRSRARGAALQTNLTIRRPAFRSNRPGRPALRNAMHEAPGQS
jgi:hypothetical protein